MNRTLAVISIAASLLPVFSAQAATVAAITWKAAAYVPPGYAGKALPPPGGQIEARLIVIDGGTIADLSSRIVRWYADDSLVSSGVGKTSFSFFAPNTGEDSVTVRASVPDYGESQLDAFRDIPLVRPEIVIDRARLPELTPLFYSFSITDPSSLSVTWDDDGETASVAARNPRNPFEFAQASLKR